MSYYHGDTLSPYWVDENYYWFKASGEMATGWINYNGTWYYADSEGVLCCYDWLCSGGKWYYFDDECRMVAGANNYLIGDILYDFDSSGACLNPYAASNPEVQTGWISVYEYGYKKWYYFNDYNGVMWTGRYGKSFDEVQYYLKDSGEMAVGWFVFTPSSGRDAKATPSGYWGYAEPNGVLCRNKWRRIDGDWYYFDKDGFMIANATNYTIDGIDYNFNSSGVCTNPYPETQTITGWYKQSYDGNTNWYYYDSEGNMYKDRWLQYNGDWYFFLPNGWMCTGSYTTDCIHFYDFDTNGVCMNPYNVRIDESCYC